MAATATPGSSAGGTHRAAIDRSPYRRIFGNAPPGAGSCARNSVFPAISSLLACDTLRPKEGAHGSEHCRRISNTEGMAVRLSRRSGTGAVFHLASATFAQDGIDRVTGFPRE